MPKEVIEKYRNLVPKELVEKTYFRGNVAIPIFITVFADVITCEANKFIGMIKHKTLDVNAVWEGMDNFFELLGNKRFLEKKFELKVYRETLELYEELLLFCSDNTSRCKKIENLQKGKTFTYIGDCLFNGTDGIIRDEKSRQRIALVISCKRTRSRINKL